MKYRKGNPVPQHIVDSIIAQVLFGERMAAKYSNAAIAARLGVGERFICKTMKRYRGDRPQAYNARGGRLRQGSHLWLRALGR